MNVVTLVHGRRLQLANLILGLERSSLLPEALWVVFMNETASALHSERFPIHCHRVQQADGRLPLARARNALLANGVQGSDWVFLDVDCIPAPGLLADYQQRLQADPQALHLGEVRYLPPHANDPGWSAHSLGQCAVAHPLSRWRPPAGEAMEHKFFWSLNFACRAEVFRRVGGFDEGYLGYGAEDTDFGFRAREQGVPLRAAQALAFHQYHPTWHPPLNHFNAIVSNARRFHQRWQHWPMEGWLAAFAERGLVDWKGSVLQVLREPGEDEIQACFDHQLTGF